MTQAKYLSEPANFCPNCGARMKEHFKVELIAKFYQKKNQNIALDPSIKMEQDFVKKTVGHKTTTVIVKMKAKKSKPDKTTKTVKIIKKIPVFVAKCGLCGETVGESAVTDIFNLELKEEGLVPIEKATIETLKNETGKDEKEVPPAQ